MLTGCPCCAGQTGERPIIGGGKGRQRLLDGRAHVAAELRVGNMALGVPPALRFASPPPPSRSLRISVFPNDHTLPLAAVAWF